jgi:hypothetical protein
MQAAPGVRRRITFSRLLIRSFYLHFVLCPPRHNMFIRLDSSLPIPGIKQEPICSNKQFEHGTFDHPSSSAHQIGPAPFVFPLSAKSTQIRPCAYLPHRAAPRQPSLWCPSTLWASLPRPRLSTVCGYRGSVFLPRGGFGAELNYAESSRVKFVYKVWIAGRESRIAGHQPPTDY